MQGEAGGAGGGPRGAEARPVEIVAHHLGQAIVVLDQQDAVGHGWHSRSNQRAAFADRVVLSDLAELWAFANAMYHRSEITVKPITNRNGGWLTQAA